MITKYIGQKPIVASLNEELKAMENAEKAGIPFAHCPKLFGGWTGSGKSFLARAYAAQLESRGYNYIEVPPKAGWKDVYSIFDKIRQIDEDGNFSCSPYVIFWDEMQGQNSDIIQLLKAMIQEWNKCHTVTRQGCIFPYDPFYHCHIFASNNDIDPALTRRANSYTLTESTPDEMREMAELIICRAHGLKMGDAAFEALLSRCKPFPGDLQEVSRPLFIRSQALGTTVISADTVTEVLRSKGFFPMGLRRPDMAIVNALATKGIQPTKVLRFAAKDDKPNDTQKKVDWLINAGLVIPARNGYTLSDKGADYAKKIIAAQKKAAAKK